MIVARGVSHKTCPVELRERLAERSGDALSALKDRGLGEAVVLSTCNRFEVYASGEGSAQELLSGCLEDLAGGALGRSEYSFAGPDAVRHLFRVAAGLDSLVVGEAEILGQVKQAYEKARQAGMTAKVTNVLFQRAIFVGKKVRTDTGIGVGHLSVASVAVDLAERIFGSLRDREVLILGAGKMAELTSKHLTSCKIGRLLVANRTHSRGEELAARFQGTAIPWDSFPSRFATADIVIGSTGADRAVVTRDMVAAALPARKGRSLFFIDIAMPRDVDDSVNDLDHVYLYSLADLEGVVKENVERRKGELEAAARLVEELARGFAEWESKVGTPEEGSLRHVNAAGPRAAEERP